MYSRTDSPAHIVQEVIDNASDEALAGFAKAIRVTLHQDGSVTVEDDGRGIPVGQHPTEKVSVIELVFSELHTGGKFDKAHGGAYTFSGGLHGVGVAVTNALSRRLEVEVKRDGGLHRMVFEDGAVADKLRRIAAPGAKGPDPEGRSPAWLAAKTGTRVRCWPDPKYFDSPVVSVAEMDRLLRSKALLLPGVAYELAVEKTGEARRYAYPGGMTQYLAEASGGEPVAPIYAAEKFAAAGGDFADGEGATWALAWSEEGELARESFVNLIPTPAGGTHEAGLRDGVFQGVRNFVDHHALLPKGVKLLPEDVFARLSFVLSARVLDPQFQGQTKEKLTNRDAVKLVSSMLRDPFELWLNEHVEAGKKIADLAIRQAQARARAGQKVEKKKSSGVAVLPGKLTDCETDDPARAEIFLVEGDSAGGSAKNGRDKEHQAILPLRGKVLNSFEVERDRLFANNEIHDIAVAIGVDPHGPGEAADLSGLRYHKIIILADADIDGAHISVLLLTLFFRHFPRLIEGGYVYLGRPPLYRLDVPGGGRNKPPRKLYALDDGELEALTEKVRKEGIDPAKCQVSRFKGLGEMNPEQLFETTLNPDTRRLLQVAFDDDPGTTASTMTMLMGKNEASSRRAWVEEYGDRAEADV
jgi:topoisomerase-4 subunit B